MSLIDIAVVLLLALGLLLGWRRGLLRSLITSVFLVAGIVVGFGHPAVAAGFAPTPALRPLMGLVVVAVFVVGGWLIARTVAPMIHRRIPGLNAVDHIAGMVAGGVAALVSISFLLSALLTLDQATAPINQAVTVGSSQITAIQQFVSQHPQAAIVLDANDLRSVQDRLGTTTVASADIGHISAILGVLRWLHSQLVQSHVAPLIFGVAEHIPIVGQGRSWPSQ